MLHQHQQQQFNLQTPTPGMLSLAAKFDICQQVTNAMTYLHDKNVVHGRLTSTNIYIEPNQRVKISLIDEHEMPLMRAASTIDNTTSGNNLQDEQEAQQTTDTRYQLDTSSLNYLSPELIRTIGMGAGADCRLDCSTLSKMSDVFSFGTILFELFEERLPFTTKHQQPTSTNSPDINTSLNKQQQQHRHLSCNETLLPSVDQIIYQIGSGRIADINLRTDKTFRMSSRVHDLIAACWSTEADMRPQFKQLVFA